MTEQAFTHFDQRGNAIMVDVGDKSITSRRASASGSIFVCREILDAVRGGTAAKGDVLGAARIAGIMGSKQTSSLIPLCHPLSLTNCSLDFAIDESRSCITAVSTVKTTGRTGVEMEALTAVSVALLTIYDMCKAIDKGMEISEIVLLSKDGGKSGLFERSSPDRAGSERISPFLFAISGVKNSGKTTLITKLLPLLSARGLKTAVIKHDGHDFTPDVPGTDSWKIREAGAWGAAVFSEDRFLLTGQGSLTEADLRSWFAEADLILLEGFKRSPYPKLELIRGENGNAPVCDPRTVAAYVTDAEANLPAEPASESGSKAEPAAGPEHCGVPRPIPRLSPDDPEAISDLIVRLVKEASTL